MRSGSRCRPPCLRAPTVIRKQISFLQSHRRSCHEAENFGVATTSAAILGRKRGDEHADLMPVLDPVPFKAVQGKTIFRRRRSVSTARGSHRAVEWHAHWRAALDRSRRAHGLGIVLDTSLERLDRHQQARAHDHEQATVVVHALRHRR